MNPDVVPGSLIIRAIHEWIKLITVIPTKAGIFDFIKRSPVAAINDIVSGRPLDVITLSEMK